MEERRPRLTFIPQGMGETAGMAGVACGAFPLPLTITLLLGLLGGQPDLLPVIAIGAVTGFVVSKALTPFLPKFRPKSAGGVNIRRPEFPVLLFSESLVVCTQCER